ncbi:hypothetical protein KEJ27_07775 [Candidatus Bathyarchaeota archaeon]|nr:hypothetical protein [Candidatus Bathyarchaeota archaeon]MBS7618489.1 hypothetical protein [Candidatus Bathyarchaeota archaeon]
MFDIAVYDNSIYMTGYTSSFISPRLLPKDVFVASFASDGSLKWFKTIEGAGYEGVMDIATYDDSLFTAGSTDSFDAGGNDAFIASLFDSDGALRWLKTVGGAEMEYASCIAVYGDSI